MNNKDSLLLSEAYSKVLNRTLVQEAGIEDHEESEHCDDAEHGCDCDGCHECIDNQKEEVKEEAPVAQENAGVPSVEETLRGCSVAELHKVLDVVKTALGSYNGSPESRQGLESMIGLTQKELDSKLHGESL
jgi:hypothetical protein